MACPPKCSFKDRQSISKHIPQSKHNLGLKKQHCASVDKTQGMKIMRSAPVLIISTGVERTCARRTTHVRQLLGYHFTIPKGLGFDLDSFTTAGYSPISVSTVIRQSLSHGGKCRLKQLENRRKKRFGNRRLNPPRGPGESTLAYNRQLA